MRKYAVLVLGALVLVVGAFVLGRFSNGPGPDHTPDTRPTDRAEERPPAPVGTAVVTDPLPAQQAPAVVRDLDLVRQRLRPGKTYHTILRGTLHTVGTDSAWGVESVVDVNYAFEAQIDREIVENDGQVIVEHRHFRDVRSVKVDTDLKDLRLNLGDAKVPVLFAVGAVWPRVAFVVDRIDGVSTAPALDLLRALGVDPATVTGAKPRVFKIFTQFDGLSGKSVKLVYWNKEERSGVIRIEPLEGEMTESEQFLHHHSAVLSDALLFPEKKKVGDSWTVAGNNFSNLLDPGLRAAVRGEVSMARRSNRMVDGKEMYVLAAEAGRLELDSADREEGRIGWFEPRGEMFFSPEEQAVVRAELTGKGLLERVSRRHLLFKTEMKQSPDLSVVYSCRVDDTPAGGAK